MATTSYTGREKGGSPSVSTVPIQLRALELSGFRGISDAPGEQLRLEGFGHRNIFIGQNNAGKSTVFNWLLFVVQQLRGIGDEPLHFVQNVSSDPGWFWQQNERVKLQAVLTFTSPEPEYVRPLDLPPRTELIQNGEWQLGISVVAVQQSRISCLVTPRVWFEDRHDWFEAVRRSLRQSHALERVVSAGEYEPHIQGTRAHFLIFARPLVHSLREWVSYARFFDPFRSFSRTSRADQRVEDGSGVLKRLLDWQNDQKRAASFHRFRGRLLTRLNHLFDPHFASLEMKATPSPDMSLTIDAQDAIPIPLQAMGSGIAEMVIILAALEEDAEGNARGCHYYIEEPELHLHPRLLRRFMAELADFKDVQFFISSHSNVVLDSLSSYRDRVFLFSQTAKGSCRAEACHGVVQQHAILDALGVNGSALLQTNCVIWVEGPSDRLYLRKWLEEIAATARETLLEGADYSFVFYGGKVLSHFQFEPDEDVLQDLIPMLSISRFSAVVMDRDTPPNQPEESLTATKRKILEGARRDEAHRLARVTVGREIENDLPQAVFKEAVATRLKRPVTDFGTLTLTGERRYMDEILSSLQLTGGEAESCRRKLEDKVDLARKVLEVCSQRRQGLGDPPQYVRDLVEFIRKSRVL
jgi:hypothetical protein